MCEYDEDDEDNSDRRDLSLYIQETGQSMIDQRIGKEDKSGGLEESKLFAVKRESACSSMDEGRAFDITCDTDEEEGSALKVPSAEAIPSHVAKFLSYSRNDPNEGKVFDPIYDELSNYVRRRDSAGMEL